MSQSPQLNLMHKKYPSVLQIQTLSIIVNHISLKRLWIQLKTMFILIQSALRLIHYQVKVIQIIYLHVSMTLKKKQKIIIFQISIKKTKLISVYHHFHGRKNVYFGLD